MIIEIIGPGDPRWQGPPSRERIQVIKSLTYTDANGKRYYRTGPGAAFRKMWTGKKIYNEAQEHFDALNVAIDLWSR